MVSDPSSHQGKVAAFVTDYRKVLEVYAGSEKETAKYAEELLSWEREHWSQQEGQK